MGLPTAHRLKHYRDFSRVYRLGRRHTSSHLVLRALRVAPGWTESRKATNADSSGQSGRDAADAGNISADHPDSDMGVSADQRLRSTAIAESAPPTRIGIAVSLKVSKRAVVRNRLKRQLRAALRSLLPELPAGWLIVISVRPGQPECASDQFLQELKQLLIAAEILHHGH